TGDLATTQAPDPAQHSYRPATLEPGAEVVGGGLDLLPGQLAVDLEAKDIGLAGLDDLDRRSVQRTASLDPGERPLTLLAGEGLVADVRKYCAFQPGQRPQPGLVADHRDPSQAGKLAEEWHGAP